MPQITFSKKTENEDRPSFKFDDPKSDLREVMKRYDRQTNLIIGVLVVSLVIMIVMTGTLIIDSFHFNAAVYKEYSDKIDAQNQSMITNQKMLDQIQQDQSLIKSLSNKIYK
ncbi:MAG TPA: hypothetical protein VGO21_03555 [Candidatus Paceibacterota bacterium]|jgi:hypothetical protein|nr:hypothetical protein [Candidatus Paceibacterota bacterium]